MEKLETASEIKQVAFAESVRCPHCNHEMVAKYDVVLEKCEKCGILLNGLPTEKKHIKVPKITKEKSLATQKILQQIHAKAQEDIEKHRQLELQKDELLKETEKQKTKKSSNLKWFVISGVLLLMSTAGYFELNKESMLSAISPNTNATNNFDVQNQLPEQDATQKTDEKTPQILNGFGIEPTSTEPNKLDISEIFSVLNDSAAWDNFLAQNSRVLLAEKFPENAAKLNTFIIENELYIDVSGELFNATQQDKRTKKRNLTDDYIVTIDNRLMPLSPQEQAIYYAQASRYLPLENGTNAFFEKTENLLANFSKPEEQLSVILKLAVTYSKIGNAESAMKHFNKISNLLELISDIDVQVKFRLEIAKTYQDLKNTTVALQWLNSCEPLIKQLKSETLTQFVSSYARFKPSKDVLDLLERINDNKRYDLRLYQAINQALDAGLISEALALNKNFHLMSYKALANALIARYSPTIANELVANSEQLLGSLTPVEKAVIASSLVDYYGKIKNTEKIATFSGISRKALDSFPASNTKDILLETVIKNYLHGFQIRAANNLLVAIQSTAIKTRLNIEISQNANVAGLLK